MNEPLFIDRYRPELVLCEINVGDWYQLYFDIDNPNEESSCQAYFNGDFWMYGQDHNGEDEVCCHAHVPYKIVKLEI